MTRYLSATEDEPNRESLDLVRRSPLPPFCNECEGRHAPNLHGPVVASRGTGHGNLSLKGLEVVVQIWENRETRTVSFRPAVIRVPQGLVYVRFENGTSKHVIWQNVWHRPKVSP